jgi:hypothetical protein
LLKTILVQMLYSIRSERLRMEEIDYNLLFRWFVGLNADDERTMKCGTRPTFSKNRDRLLEADVAQVVLARVVEQAQAKGFGLRREPRLKSRQSENIRREWFLRQPVYTGINKMRVWLSRGRSMTPEERDYREYFCKRIAVEEDPKTFDRLVSEQTTCLNRSTVESIENTIRNQN